MSKNKYQFESKIHVYRATKRMTQLAYSISKVFDVTIEDLFDFAETEK